MCGICGFNWNDDSLLGKILKEIEHRGVNDYGKFTDEGVSLGHRRLSIIDLSDNARQPLWNEDGSLAIVFKKLVVY